MRYTLIMKWVASMTLALVLGTMFISLFHMSMGMGMSGGMTDCPFVEHGEVICPMNLTDHMEAWKSVFLSVVPTLTLLLAAAGVAIFVVTVAPNLLQNTRYLQPTLTIWSRPKTYTFSYRPLQELFSNGILHPKLF